MLEEVMLEPKRIAEVKDKVAEVSATLQELGNEKRLLAVCHLAMAGEMSVGALAEAVGLSQSALSQHLARLRIEGLVATRREAQVLYYRISDPRIRKLLEALYDIYCAEPDPTS